MLNWPADSVERRPVASLVPYARNARTHSDEQVARIMASIAEWGWTTPVLVDEDGGIIAGHGRVMAAQRMNLDDVPVMVARGWTEPQKRAYILADNKLALDAGWDIAMLELEVADLEQLGANMIVSFDDILGKGLGAGGDASTEMPGETWAVIVECRDEAHQVELIERFQADGLKVKASIG